MAFNSVSNRSVSNRVLVRKIQPLFSTTAPFEKPWIVYNLATPAQHFATWREAMDFAASYRIIVMN
jgi:hypothetical protein